MQPGLAGYPGQYGNALIRKENLDKFIHTLRTKPVIINHKDNITDGDKVGEVFNVWFNPDDGWYWCDGIITDKTAQNLISDKGWSVSCSYDFTKYNDEGGTENNIPYDIEFLDGVFTHLAIVNNPRYERANIVFNSKTEFVTVGKGENKHAIPVDYLNKDKEPKQFGGLRQEDFSKQVEEYHKLKKEWKHSPSDIKKMIEISEYILQDQLFEFKNTEFNNDFLKSSFEDMIKSTEKSIDQLKDWFDLSKNSEKHFSKEWKDYLKKHPEEFKNNTVVQNFNPNHDENGRFCEGQNKYTKDGKIYENFIDIHKDLSEKSPPHWEGKTVEEALEYLGIKDNQSVKIKSPVEDVTIYKSHMEHLIEDNNAYRKKYLNRAIRTIQAPNLILKTGDYNNYLKVFTDENDKIKPHLQIVKTKGDGNFYVTTMKPTKQQVKKFILEGQAIYDLSSMSSTKSTDTNIITNSIDNLNPKHEEILSKIDNAKEHKMALLEELKKLITKVENDKGEEMDDDKKEKVDNEKVDKRKLIDEVGGILKDKVSEEIWRTVIGKIEKLGYNESQAGTSDNKKVKNESKENKEKVEELKKEVKEDVENKKKCDNSVENAKTDFFNKMNEVYNASTSPKEENVYVSRESKLQAAKDYFSK